MPNRNNNVETDDGLIWSTFIGHAPEPTEPTDNTTPFDDENPPTVIDHGLGLESQISAEPSIITLDSNSISEAMNSMMQGMQTSGDRGFFNRPITSRRIVSLSDMISRESGGIDHPSPTKQDTPIDPESIVTLRTGKTAKFKDCANIHGKYYLKTDENITLDYFEPERYVHKGDCSSLNATFDDNGYLTNKVDFYDPRFVKRNTLVEVRDGKMHVISDYNALPKQYYTECISTNIWHHNSIAGKNVDTEKRMKVRARKATNIYKPSPFKSDLKKDYAMGIKSPSFIKTEGKRYTYGIEMETISGKLPLYLDDQLNYLAIRDGSLKDDDGEEYGYEYEQVYLLVIQVYYKLRNYVML